MKELIVSILVTFGVLSPFHGTEPPQINTDGLIYHTVVAEDEPELVSLGTFCLTAYCPCSNCCGKSDGITATGTRATAGCTIAADPNILPYGTKVIINGNTYVVEDCGGGIQQNRIDVFFDSHFDALNFGVQTAEVFVEVEKG